MNWSTSILIPRGFRVAGVHCGVKPDPQKPDLALFVSEGPCAAAGVFTLNRVCGAPVKVSRERVPRNTARAVVVNSGNANACTGQRGIADARRMTELVAQQLGCDANDVLVCSTGVIGRFLPMENIVAGIDAGLDQLSDTSAQLESAALAMMTTDTVPKLAMREREIAGTTVRVTGVAKGAAMIAPNMATMLAVVLTDAALSPEQGDAMLRHAVDRSFNCISVEGHTSTSDTVLLLANGAAGHARDASSAPTKDATAARAARSRADDLGLEFVDPTELEIPSAAIEMFPLESILEHCVIPIGFDDRKLIVAASDPLAGDVFDKLRFVLNREIRVVMATEEAIRTATRRHFGSDCDPRLQEMLDDVCRELAQAIVQDAEGAEHFITLDVRGCRTRAEALRIARAVADSPLVKTAIAGADPNWGRIVSAVGYCGVEVEEKNITLTLNGVPLYAAGAPVEFDAAELSKLLKLNRDVLLELDLDLGAESARFWTSDLTEEYVRLNADYTT